MVELMVEKKCSRCDQAGRFPPKGNVCYDCINKRKQRTRDARRACPPVLPDGYYKQCRNCLHLLSAALFNKSCANSDGLRAICRICQRRLKADYYARNRERCKEKTRSWFKRVGAQRAKDLVRRVLVGYGGKCECCGEGNLKFLNLDHVYGGGRTHRQFIGQKLRKWAEDNNYPPSLRVLCFNCNLAREHNQGVCPHVEELTSLVSK